MRMTKQVAEVDSPTPMDPARATALFWAAVAADVSGDDTRLDPVEVSQAAKLLGRDLAETVAAVQQVEAVADRADVATAEVRHAAALRQLTEAQERQAAAVAEHDRAVRLLADAENVARGAVTKSKQARRDAFDLLADLVRRDLPRELVPLVLQADDLPTELRRRVVPVQNITIITGGAA